MSITRRDFLKVGAGATAAIISSGAFAAQGRYPSISELRRLYVPVAEREIDRNELGDSVREKFDQNIARVATDQGFDPNDFTPKYTHNYFVVPSSDSVRQVIKNVCDDSYRFMRTHPQLKDEFGDLELEWIAVREGDDYSKDYSHRAFIGRGRFDVLSLNAEHNLQKDVRIESNLTRYDHGPSLEIVGREDTGKPSLFHIFVSSYAQIYVIAAPFSETVPLLVEEATYNFFKGDKFRARGASETISEAISHILTLESIEKYGASNASKLSSMVEDKLARRKDYPYTYVPGAVRYIRSLGKEGIKKALDMYRQNPMVFLQNAINFKN